MIITNKFGLPETLVDAVKFDGHRTHGNISVTGLIGPTQIFYLKNKHANEITRDVSGMIWSLFGTAVHAVLERANITTVRRQAFMEVINCLKEYVARNENRNLNEGETETEAEQASRVLKWLLNYMLNYFPELKDRYIFEISMVEEYNGWRVSGTLDLYDKIDCILFDYKVVKVYSYIYPETRKSWKLQLNCYALFLKKRGYEVKEIKVVAIFKDWNKQKAFTDPAYPKRNVMTIDIGIYPEDQMDKWVLHRVKLHQKALEDGPEPCTGVDMWASARMFSVIQKGNVRAIPGTKTENEEVAKKFIRDQQHSYKKELLIKEVPAVYRRCAEFCDVSDFCSQWKRIQSEQNGEEIDFE